MSSQSKQSVVLFYALTCIFKNLKNKIRVKRGDKTIVIGLQLNIAKENFYEVKAVKWLQCLPHML